VVEVKAPLNIAAVGKATLEKDFDKLNGVYQIYTPDQIVEMATLSAVQTKGMTFNIARDIDMRGLSIVPIAQFEGILQGNGKTVSNYNVNSMVGNNAGIVAVNNGEIKDITLIGNVDVTVVSGFKKTYNIGGVVGENNGILSNITLAGQTLSLDGGYNMTTFGTVRAFNKSLNTQVKYNIGGIAGVEGAKSVITNCVTTAPVAEVKDANGNVTVEKVVGTTVKFEAMLAILGVEANIGGLTAQKHGDAAIEVKAAGAMVFLTINKI
ncbi:MAG: hypothetical protein RR348_03685, partial [Clostridia bacterium]